MKALRDRNTRTAVAASGRRLARVAARRAARVAVTSWTAQTTLAAALGAGIGDRPYSPIVSLDGRRVYVTNYFSGTVSVIDTADDTVVETIPGYTEARLTPDGRFVYTRSTVDERSGITFISTTDDLVTFVPAAGAEEGLSDAQLSPDGRSFYVVSYAEDSALLVVSLDGDRPALGDDAQAV